MIDDIGRGEELVFTVIADHPPSCNVYVYGHLCRRMCIHFALREPSELQRYDTVLL
jgi:DNA primase catalytic subunit